MTNTLHASKRAATQDELALIPWLSLLDAKRQQQVAPEIWVTRAQAGDYVCRAGRPVTYWFGVIDGLLKMSANAADGKSISFLGMPAGAWFGEGTVLKREPYRYDVLALRDSTVVGISVASFDNLIANSIAFNGFIMRQLNERLSQFIAAREVDRLSNPEMRVARTLGALFNPALHPAVGVSMRITQQELAYLVGLSRQRVNTALTTLQARHMIRIEYGGLRVLDMDQLKACQ